jgi:hypothetical protein
MLVKFLRIFGRGRPPTGSRVDIISLHAFDRMGINHSLLKLADNPLYGFGGKGTFPLGKIKLPLSLGIAPIARS